MPSNGSVAVAIAAVILTTSPALREAPLRVRGTIDAIKLGRCVGSTGRQP
ncbi:hypothetical protein MKK69_04155 [Methylobacterium sp. J-026]|nr:hypothetical protein [Methylobacterium sp. J-026]MCJ2133264.1 hypothetical protein [Methylobacterium sp. J-026]